MANRATLINKAEPSYSDADVGSGFLATNYSIAVLWPIIFQRTDLRYFEGTDSESGEAFRVPYLATTVNAGLQNWKKRESIIRKALSPIGLAAMEQLEGTLSQLKERFVLLDTWELWMMEPEGFDVELMTYIEEVSCGRVSKLKEQCSIRLDEEEIYHYMGYQWR